MRPPPPPVGPETMPEALARTRALAPDIEAVVGPDGRMTFAELDREVALLSAAMQASGVRHGTRVGLCLGNGVRWVALFLAAACLGAVTVPVNTRFRADELRHVLETAQVEMLFCATRVLGSDFEAALAQIAPQQPGGRLPNADLPDLRIVVMLGEGAVDTGFQDWQTLRAMGHEHTARTAAPPRGADDMLIQFTSGTTAFPKGVRLSQRAMLANGYVSGHRLGLRAGDRLHSARPFFHVAGTTLSILSCLQHCATLVTMERFEPEAALDLLEGEACTHFAGNETLMRMLLEHPGRKARKLKLRGAWLAAGPDTLRRTVEELGAPEVVAGYGLSEASPNVAQSAIWEPEEIRLRGDMTPQPGVELRLRDPDTGAEIASPGRGELLLRGWCVMTGYLDLPEETARAIDAQGWLHTGDLAEIDANGRMRFLGRARDMLRVGGENVSPAEVEELLCRHPAVEAAQVVGVPDARLAEVPAAFVVSAHAGLDAAELIEWARSRMAGFKVPRHLWIERDITALSMTESAKPRKSALAERARNLIAGSEDA